MSTNGSPSEPIGDAPPISRKSRCGTELSPLLPIVASTSRRWTTVTDLDRERPRLQVAVERERSVSDVDHHVVAVGALEARRARVRWPAGRLVGQRVEQRDDLARRDREHVGAVAREVSELGGIVVHEEPGIVELHEVDREPQSGSTGRR